MIIIKAESINGVKLSLCATKTSSCQVKQCKDQIQMKIKHFLLSVCQDPERILLLQPCCYHRWSCDLLLVHDPGTCVLVPVLLLDARFNTDDSKLWDSLHCMSSVHALVGWDHRAWYWFTCRHDSYNVISLNILRLEKKKKILCGLCQEVWLHCTLVCLYVCTVLCAGTWQTGSQ